MYKYIKEHEELIKNLMSKAEFDAQELKKYHLTQISFLQHERLVHLLVTLFFGIIFFTSYVLTVFCASPFLLVLDIIVTILELFYIAHYYRLENAVQRWYKIYNNL